MRWILYEFERKREYETDFSFFFHRKNWKNEVSIKKKRYKNMTGRKDQFVEFETLLDVCATCLGTQDNAPQT